jgi:hypothetical protein
MVFRFEEPEQEMGANNNKKSVATLHIAVTIEEGVFTISKEIFLNTSVNHRLYFDNLRNYSQEKS